MMHFHKKLTRLTALALSALMIASAPLAYATSLEDLEDEKESLSQKKEELKDKIDGLEVEETEKEKYQAELAGKIDDLQGQIDSAAKNIKTLNESITDLEKELKRSDDEIKDTLELLKKRLAALYSAGKVSTLEILFDSKSLHDFSVRSEMITNITHNDRMLIDEVSAYMNETKADRDTLKQEKETLADEKKKLESNQTELTTLEAENNELLKQIREEKGKAKDELERTEYEEYALSNAISQKIKEMQDKLKPATPTPTPVPTVEPTPTPTPVPPQETDDDGNALPTPTPTPIPEVKPTPTPTPIPEAPSVPDYNPGEGFGWPVPGWGAGYPFGNGHYGLDIPASYGTPIVASRSGTVMVANGFDEWGDSWGYYVSIYHDSTYATLYAHMSSVAVSEGQWVNKGDVIGYVGDTGYSFGNHCHFEVYQNGVRVNPAQFV